MLGSTVFLRIAPNYGQLLFPSTLCPDKALPSERKRENKQFFGTDRERRGGSGFQKFHIPLILTKDNKTMTTNTTSCFVANAAMEKFIKTIAFKPIGSLCNKTLDTRIALNGPPDQELDGWGVLGYQVQKFSWSKQASAALLEQQSSNIYLLLCWSTDSRSKHPQHFIW